MPVHYERTGGVAVVTIDRPERRNAVDRDTAGSLHEAWRRFAADDGALVGILTGAGGHFSAGFDLKAFDLVDRPEGYLGFTRLTVDKPTIAAVGGYCVAGGLEMALWCDLRVAGEDAVFGCFERRFGVPLVDGGTQRLPRLVGLSRALDMILTGRPVGAAEAFRIGLADRVVAAGHELAAAQELAGVIGSFPQATVRSDRAAVLAGLGRPLEEGLVIERDAGAAVLDVAAEGAARFAKGAGRGGEGVM
ncbi:MAG: crotonase/enoyl-CoA hydratase family protein [Acidimicrobiia bacterium]